MGDVLFGRCDCCGKETDVQRKYFYYAIKCECHSPEHFEIVSYCKNCVPVAPKITNITIKTSELNIILRGVKLKKIKDNLNARDK